MDSIEKNIVKLFLNISVPHEFLKGKCTIFIKSSKIDNDSYVKIVSLKNELSNDINFQKDENVIYFDFMRLVIAIMKKYL